MHSCPQRVTDRTVFIYGLACPIEGVVRYVGQSVDPYGRLVSHGYDGTPAMLAWLGQLRDSGRRPDVLILEVADRLSASKRERIWIRHFERRHGDRLINSVRGEPDSPDSARRVRRLATLQRVADWMHREELDPEGEQLFAEVRAVLEKKRGRPRKLDRAAAADAVREHGSVEAAARALKMSPTTVRGSLRADETDF